MDNIIRFTGCLPPCKYTEFSLAYPPVGTLVDDGSTSFDLRFSKSSLILKKEVLVYPLSSLVAEFGGTFGLFVGFSFIMFWDTAEFFFKHMIEIMK